MKKIFTLLTLILTYNICNAECFTPNSYTEIADLSSRGFLILKNKMELTPDQNIGNCTIRTKAKEIDLKGSKGFYLSFTGYHYEKTATQKELVDFVDNYGEKMFGTSNFYVLSKYERIQAIDMVISDHMMEAFYAGNVNFHLSAKNNDIAFRMECTGIKNVGDLERSLRSVFEICVKH